MVKTFTARSPERAFTRTYNLLLVEDHPLMRQVLRQLFEAEADLSLLAEVDSAEAALERLPELSPDLVLVDLSLPGMSGLQLIKRLKIERPALRCLVVTGHVDPLYRAAAREAGAAGYVTKDDPDEILAAVRRVLRVL